MSADKNLERMTQLMNDARLLNMTESVLYPLLQKHMDQKVKQMCARFRSGHTEFIQDVAQLSYIEELTSELTRKQAQGNRARKDLTDGTN